MKIEENVYLAHYGILRRSGRYPWGSGSNVQHSRNMLSHIEELTKEGLSEKEIAEGFGMTVAQLRDEKTIATEESRFADISQAYRLREKGMSVSAIAERMGRSESTVRGFLAPGQLEKTQITKTIADTVRGGIEKHGFVDVGTGNETQMGVSREKLRAAVTMLESEGYQVHTYRVPQSDGKQFTTMKVIGGKDSTKQEAWEARGQLAGIDKFSEDGGRSFLGIHEPISIDPSRVAVRYADQGGAVEDGIIYIRPGAKDLSLGGANYAQARISVGKDHYIKGLAIYRDDMPAGVDILFNTAKKNTGNKLDALKPKKDDIDNPFGAIVRQIVKRDEHGVEKVVSAVNIVRQEGEWLNWSDSLSAQFLAKQDLKLTAKQLDMAYERRREELGSILKLTNPVVKKKLLESFADSADSASVKLDAAAIPRQGWHVIVPSNKLRPDEIYAPNYRDGERVSLVRFPHAGPFEIPELVVNNRHKPSIKLMGNARDAVGIHHSVAERMSGADFDGDFVVVIPSGDKRVQSAPPLKGVMGFDPRASYPGYPGMKVLTDSGKQNLMGQVSNLITDMTVKNAPPEDMARAVRHSMVIIDAENHKLNYKQSEIDHGIRQLKTKYQGGPTRGASTLLSLANAQVRVPTRRLRRASEGGHIDPDTGDLVYTPKNETYTDGKGKKVFRTEISKQMAETSDARTLSTGSAVETLYAGYANGLKKLAREARVAYLGVPNLKQSPSAKKVYASEVKELDAQMELVRMNRPVERKAQAVADAIFAMKLEANPEMDNATKRKIRVQAVTEARARLNAKSHKIKITPQQWNAIQAGAVSNSKLIEIIDNADLEVVKELATPRAKESLGSAQRARAISLFKAGRTREEIATALGVSITTLDTALYAEAGGSGS